MVGQAEIGVAAFAGGFGHVFECIGAVGLRRVGVEHAA
jgi:hypothetical protein